MHVPALCTASAMMGTVCAVPNKSSIGHIVPLLWTVPSPFSDLHIFSTQEVLVSISSALQMEKLI